ncbi:MAG: hypothetical protein AAFO82_13890, partial [Bacteroidota bacterium]
MSDELLRAVQLYLGYIGFIVLFANTLISFTFLRKSSSKLTYFRLYILFSLIIQIISYILWQQKKNNLFFLHFLTIVEFFTLSLFYGSILDWKKHKKLF